MIQSNKPITSIIKHKIGPLLNEAMNMINIYISNINNNEFDIITTQFCIKSLRETSPHIDKFISTLGKKTNITFKQMINKLQSYSEEYYTYEDLINKNQTLLHMKIMSLAIKSTIESLDSLLQWIS